jgi:hypothetical protein
MYNCAANTRTIFMLPIQAIAKTCMGLLLCCLRGVPSHFHVPCPLLVLEQIGLEDIAAWHQQQAGRASSAQEQQQQQSKQPAAAPADDSSSSSSSDGPRDWKGEPMKLNPGGS